jgi:hypothetical protein
VLLKCGLDTFVQGLGGEAVEAVLMVSHVLFWLRQGARMQGSVFPSLKSPKLEIHPR